MGKTLVVRDDDPAVRAWRRMQTADEPASAAWLAVPFRMFVNVTFLGTLLQMEFGGLALKAALAWAGGAGLAFALAWMFLSWWYGGDLPQLFLRSLLITSLIALWFAGHLFLIR